MNVPIQFVDAVFNNPAGSAKWAEGFDHLRFMCPCNCGGAHYVDLPVRPKCPDGWDWDGNIEQPTLSPSILNRTGNCEWHGHLVKGVFVPC